MKLLALDTSTTACTAALAVAGRVIERHEVREREHTKILTPMLRELMAEGGLDYGDLDAIVLGNGPGSFIGMRIAASMAQGIAFAAGLRVVPVSSLAALAVRAFAGSDARQAAVTQDARMEQVYLGLYRRGADDLPDPLADERLRGRHRRSRRRLAAIPEAGGRQRRAGVLRFRVSLAARGGPPRTRSERLAARGVDQPGRGVAGLSAARGCGSVRRANILTVL